jgi:hypothetical protein
VVVVRALVKVEEVMMVVTVAERLLHRQLGSVRELYVHCEGHSCSICHTLSHVASLLNRHDDDRDADLFDLV